MTAERLRLPVLLKSLLAWLALLLLAVANGALREAVLIPSLGQRSGLVLSGVLLCLAVALVAHVFVRRVKGLSAADGLRVGVLWLCLTLAFELGLGRLVQRKPWPELLEAYTFEGGNLWPVVLVVILVAPYVAARWPARAATCPRSASTR